MKIIVTGGAGFIGGNFIHHMVNKYPEYQIVNLDLLTYAGNLETLKPVENKPNYKINYNKADLTDVNADKCAYVQNVESELVGKSLTDSTVTATLMVHTHIQEKKSHQQSLLKMVQQN